MIETMNLARLERRPFHRIFEEQGEYVVGSLRALDIPAEELEDATQEVFLVVCQRTRDYEERGKLRAWLNSICKRVAWNRCRSRRRSREELVDSCDFEVRATQHEQLIITEALELGSRLLDGLPTEQRDVFWLYEVENKPMADIARAANCPLQTAYSRLHRARERIQAAVNSGR